MRPTTSEPLTGRIDGHGRTPMGPSGETVLDVLSTLNPARCWRNLCEPAGRPAAGVPTPAPDGNDEHLPVNYPFGISCAAGALGGYSAAATSPGRPVATGGRCETSKPLRLVRAGTGYSRARAIDRRPVRHPADEPAGLAAATELVRRCPVRLAGRGGLPRGDDPRSGGNAPA